MNTERRKVNLRGARIKVGHGAMKRMRGGVSTAGRRKRLRGWHAYDARRHRELFMPALARTKSGEEHKKLRKLCTFPHSFWCKTQNKKIVFICILYWFFEGTEFLAIVYPTVVLI